MEDDAIKIDSGKKDMRLYQPKYIFDLLTPLTVGTSVMLTGADDTFRLLEPRAGGERGARR